MRENELVVSELSDTKKSGKVFVDYLQNSHGRTMICPYSLRADQGATVSWPLDWPEVKKGLKPAELNLLTVVKRKTDPWKNILENQQELEVE
jgi:bifunctional non-homologous end joining protein LigD